MSEQQAASKCPHPEAVGTRWGDPISEERIPQLKSLLGKSGTGMSNINGRRVWHGPFSGEHLTGADLWWLATQLSTIGPDIGYQPEFRNPHFIDEGEEDKGEDRLSQVLHLEGALLTDGHLEGATLVQAYLQGARLAGSHLEGANLAYADLEGANLIGAHLEGAKLFKARIEGANLFEAHLEGTDLRQAHLAGFELPPCDLRLAFLDSGTKLDHILLGTRQSGYVSVVDVR